MMKDNYVRKAIVLYWEDGDTVKLDVDMGMQIHREALYRLYGIEAPKKKLPEGKLTLAEVERLAPAGAVIHVQIYKVPEKYGRWMVDVYLDELVGTTLNDHLIGEGFASAYFGGKKVV